MKTNLAPFHSGLAYWSLFVGFGMGLFFSIRVRNKMRAQEKPIRLKAFLAQDEYLRNDFYGALLGWAGCALSLIVVIFPNSH
jgi:hypothetical protein